MDWVTYIPGLACLFWALIHSLTAFRTDSFKAVLPALLTLGVFLISDSIYADPSSGTGQLLAGVMTAQITAPCVIPLVVTYLRILYREDGRMKPLTLLWTIIPAVLFTSGALLYAIGAEEIVEMTGEMARSGSDMAGAQAQGVARLYHISTTVVLRIVLAVQMAYLAIMMAVLSVRGRGRLRHLTRFVMRGGRISPLELQIFNLWPLLVAFALKLGIDRSVYIAHPWIQPLYSVVLTLLLSVLCYTALFGARSSVSMSEMLHAMRYNYSRSGKASAVEQMLNELIDEAEDEALRHIQERLGSEMAVEEWRRGELPAEEARTVADGVFSAVAESWDEDSLEVRFQKIMMEEQLFLQPRLSLGDVAARLGTNKTYISKLVNNSYNLGFPELINTLRVDYAEQYILSHRGAKQTEIASACGFLSASSFNNTFKKIAGVTPKVWVANYDKEHK